MQSGLRLSRILSTAPAVPRRRAPRTLRLCVVFLALPFVGAVDHGMKIQQTLGSARAAAESKNFDTAIAKLDELTQLVGAWREALLADKTDAAAPADPVAAPEPPAESVEFSVNSTHIPFKCQRKSEDGAVMKVHYVGKLIATGKIFASSFHTGSQPFRFVLGSEEVIAGWNQGLGDMCEGERRRLMVPWDLAHGEKGAKGVPPYSDVQYDFELVELSLPKIASKSKKQSRKEEL